MKKQQQAAKEAREVQALVTVGGEIAKQAGINASQDMATMLKNLETPEGRALAIKDHAVHMGVGAMFMEIIAPEFKTMAKDLEGLGNSEEIAEVLAGMWLAKVFKEIEKGLNTLED